MCNKTAKLQFPVYAYSCVAVFVHVCCVYEHLCVFVFLLVDQLMFVDLVVLIRTHAFAQQTGFSKSTKS